ncbi:MAG: D-alanine--D-alanine ligase [Planctomycetes bacterium]|nr:D-alanine--D-alanine ligase [Planctomycetota bacterium]
MEIGIAFDLKADYVSAADGAPPIVGGHAGGPGALPDDLYEEFDSIATVEGIERALARGGYKTRRLGGGRRFLESVLTKPCDLVFNIAEGFGTRSREAHVPSVLEMLQIPYTHSDPLTLATTLDKEVAKRLVASHGLATPRFAVIERADRVRDVERLALQYPLFAKPLFEGSSMGVRKKSRVRDAAELAERVERLLADYREPVLVEEFCSGPEFTVGLVGNGASLRVLGVMEIVSKAVPQAEFVYSLEVKRNDDWHLEVDYHVPPRRAPELVECVADLARGAFRALGCRDLARIDIRLDGAGSPRFLECNPLPGLKPGWSDLALLCDRAGIEYDTLILDVVRAARERWRL